VKVLYFTRDYTTHDRRFLAALAETDHEVAYLRLERSGHQLEDRPLPPGIEQISWAGGQTSFKWWDVPRLYRELKSVIRDVKPDLIQAGPIQTAAFLVGLTGFEPLVSMSWGYDLLIDAERNAAIRWATRYSLKHSAVMVGDCDTIRRKAVFYGMPDDRIVTFPWGVEIEHFSPQDNGDRAEIAEKPSLREQYGWDDKNFVLLSTRSWELIYGVEMIARAVADVARERPNLRLLMLGNGSQASIIRKIFMQAGVLEQVNFPGQISGSDLPHYYRTADLYVSASHSDGSSISLLEAMACGCPVLVSDIPGNREWIEPGVQGWWFRDGDLEDLKRTIIRAVDEDRDRLSEMGKTARTLAESRADWKRNFPELICAYNLALEVTRDQRYSKQDRVN
jgi:glycosyltransferase involved in cell wall biosynthesis